MTFLSNSLNLSFKKMNGNQSENLPRDIGDYRVNERNSYCEWPALQCPEVELMVLDPTWCFDHLIQSSCCNGKPVKKETANQSKYSITEIRRKINWTFENYSNETWVSWSWSKTLLYNLGHITSVLVCCNRKNFHHWLSLNKS